jgi:hypothetical protein
VDVAELNWDPRQPVVTADQRRACNVQHRAVKPSGHVTQFDAVFVQAPPHSTPPALLSCYTVIDYRKTRLKWGQAEFRAR